MDEAQRAVEQELAKELGFKWSEEPYGLHCVQFAGSGGWHKIESMWRKLVDTTLKLREATEHEIKLEADLDERDQDVTRLEAKLREREHRERWIPCSERLPEEGVEVEIHTRDTGRYIAKRRTNYFEFSLGNSMYYFHWQDDVTHWRPLPTPPEEAQR